MSNIVIKISNPQDFPFGKLSNHSYYPMVIDGEKYDNVTKYIYSNMLSTPTYKGHIKNMDITQKNIINKDLMRAFDYFLNETNKDLLIEFILSVKGGSKSLFVDWSVNDLIQRIEVIYLEEELENATREKLFKLIKNIKKDDKKDDKKYKKHSIKQLIKVLYFIHNDIDFESVKSVEEYYRLFDKLKRKKEKYNDIIFKYTKQRIDDKDINEIRKIKTEVIKEYEDKSTSVHDIFKQFRTNEYFYTVKESVQKGLDIILLNNKQKDILINTGDRQIIYKSSDPFLGIGDNNSGYNIVGKYLMQVRHSLRINRKESEELTKKENYNNYLYDTYVVYSFLRDKMLKGEDSLNNLVNMSTNDVLKHYHDSKSPELYNYYKSKVPSKDIIIDLYKKDLLNSIILKEINNPGTIVNNIRSLYIRTLKDILVKFSKDIVFNTYLEYIIKQKYTDFTQEQLSNAITQQITKLSYEDLKSVKDRIIELFNLNAFPDELSSEINQKIKLLNIPSDEYVKSIEDIDKDRHIELRDLIISITGGNRSRYEKYTIEELSQRLYSIYNYEDWNTKPKDEIIELIISIKGGSYSDYKNWNYKDLLVRLNSIFNVEEWENATREKLVNFINKTTKMDNTYRYKEFTNKELLAKIDFLYNYEAWTDSKQSELVRTIVSITNEDPSKYKDWKYIELTNRLDSINKDIKQLYKVSNKEPIIIYEDDKNNHPDIRPFNPDFYSKMLNIDNNLYPTIKHYIITMLISKKGVRKQADFERETNMVNYSMTVGMGVKEARKCIILDNKKGDKPQDFTNIKLSIDKYNDILKETDIKLIKLYSLKGLTKKLENTELQDLLLLTDDRQIVWDSNQEILGNNRLNKTGENYIGVKLMEIRDTIKKEREGTEEINIKTYEIIKFIEKDEFILRWIKSRVSDMCNVVYKLQTYLSIKDGISVDINEEERMKKLVNITLNNIYYQCNYLNNLSKNSDEENVPAFFINIVKRCKGMSSGVQSVYNSKGSYNNKILNKQEDIDNRIREMNDEFNGNVKTINHSIEEIKIFKRKQRDEFKKAVSNFKKGNKGKTLDKKSIIKIEEFMKEFTKYQNGEYNDFLGIKKYKRTPEEILNHNNNIKFLKRELTEYIRSAKKVESHFNIVKTDVSKEYWKIISTMIIVLIKSLDNPTKNNVRKAIIDSELILSNNEFNCKDILESKKYNCILSAILNILNGIKKFKNEFSVKTMLDIDDISLATSIILNTKFNPTILDINTNIDLFGVVEEKDNIIKTDEIKELDVDYSDNPYFSFNKLGGGKGKLMISPNDINKIEKHILEVCPTNTDSHELALYTAKQILYIKNFKYNDKVKNNRINFFATII